MPIARPPRARTRVARAHGPVDETPWLIVNPAFSELLQHVVRWTFAKLTAEPAVEFAIGVNASPHYRAQSISMQPVAAANAFIMLCTPVIPSKTSYLINRWAD